MVLETMAFFENSGIIIQVILVLSALIFFHELGHYLVARLNRVRVEVFSIGFGKEIIGWYDRAGTRWKVGILPLGGYVKMFGDADASSAADDSVKQMSDADKAVCFHHKKLWQRAAIVAAGPFANFVLAAVIYAIVFMAYEQVHREPVAAEVQEGRAGAEAGLQAGDVFLSINGREVERFRDVALIMATNPNVALSTVILRDGEEITLTMTPELVEVESPAGGKQVIGQLGIKSPDEFEVKRYGFFEAIWQGGVETVKKTTDTLDALAGIISGRIASSNLGGPIQIVRVMTDSAEQGLTHLLLLAAFLSINLGLINLFPIPVLDGGHLLFYGIEAVRGRPLGENAQEYGFRIGLALVLLLMIFATYNDIIRIVSDL